MNIWFKPLTLAELNQRGHHTLVSHLGIRFVEIGDDYLKATMPVDHTTKQPAGLLHGGASCALAETVGSTAANCCINLTEKRCVGLDINANHLRAVTGGTVFAMTRPMHLGARTHVWHIEISNDHNQLVCVARLTMAVIDANK